MSNTSSREGDVKGGVDGLGNDTPPTSGLVAGKYEIVRLLGRGGMGSVWEARHVSLGTRVAVKFVEVEPAHREEARRRFDNEARAAASIQSKHAIKVYDHGLTDDFQPYIVMELLAGEPLDRRLERVGRLSLEETARIVSQVGRALQEAHDSGITHRDLKPENIFLERGHDDEEEVAKVLDFGIAKMRDPISARPVSSSTKTGVLMGTPFFMSPEQARGLKTVDPRSDLWSLGVIVFRAVTGVLPFEGEALGDLLVKICAGPIPLPSQTAGGERFPSALDAWMTKCLDREPANRFQSAAELSLALAAVAGVPFRSVVRSRPSAASFDAAAALRSTEAGPNALATPAWRALEPQRQEDDDRVLPPPAPIAQAMTSSPFTASAAGVPTSSGVSAVAVSILAGAMLMVTIGVTLSVLRHGSTKATVGSEGLAAPSLLTSASIHPPLGSAPSSSKDPDEAAAHPGGSSESSRDSAKDVSNPIGGGAPAEPKKTAGNGATFHRTGTASPVVLPAGGARRLTPPTPQPSPPPRSLAEATPPQASAHPPAAGRPNSLPSPPPQNDPGY